MLRKISCWFGKIGFVLLLLSFLTSCGRVVLPAPVAIIQADPTLGFKALPVQFDGSRSYDLLGLPITSYQWDFGDGTVAQGAQVAHTYAKVGNFQATLTVSNPRGLSAVASVIVRVLEADPIPIDPVILPEDRFGFAPLPTLYFQAHSEPSDMALGDLNEDGSVDVVLAHPHRMGPTDHVLVLFGDGQGNFGEKLLRSESSLLQVRENLMGDAGDGPVSLAVGDLNGDAHLDVVTANAISKDLTVLWGDGQGSLAPPKRISLGHRFPSLVRLADLNQDTHLDLIIGNSFPAKLTVLLGKGAGEFEAPRDIDVSRWPIVAITVGSLNNDKRPDVSVLDKSGRLTLLCGDGDGGFYTLGSQQIQGANAWGGLGLGDFNDDDQTDIALTVEMPSSSALRFFLLGSAGEGLNRPTDRAIGANPVDLQIADVDLDGDLDILLSACCQDEMVASATLAVFRGDGTGQFTGPFYYSLGIGRVAPSRLALVDFDRDGDLDVITLNASTLFPLQASGSITLLRNTIQ
jgi:PKD repeat protein